MLPLALLALPLAPAAPVPAAVTVDRRPDSGLSRLLTTGLRWKVASVLGDIAYDLNTFGGAIAECERALAAELAKPKPSPAAIDNWVETLRDTRTDYATLVTNAAALRRLRDRLGGR